MRVLVTRPAAQADTLCDGITQSGGIPVRFPVIEIRFIEPEPEFTASIRDMDPRDRVIFVSANAVIGLSHACRRLGADLPRESRIAAIGPATARALDEIGLPATLTPESGFTSEALLAMKELREVRGEPIFIVRGTGGRSTLGRTLADRGAYVSYLEVYRRQRPQTPSTAVLEALDRGEIDLLTCTSGEALDNLIELTRGIRSGVIEHIPMVVGGHRVTRLATGRGFRQVITAPDPSDASILDTTRRWGRDRPLPG